MTMGKKERGFTKKRKAAFLLAYCECGSVTTSADAAGINRWTHYRWLKTDSQYEDSFGEAQISAASQLEDEALRRAISGVKTYKFHEGEPIMIDCPLDHEECVKEIEIDGKTVGRRHYYEEKHSDTLLMFLLKKHKPEYRERFEARVTGTFEHTGTIAVRSVVQELMQSDEYLDYARNRIEHTIPVPVRGDGEPRKMEDGPSSNGDRSSGNGHDPGSNGKDTDH